MLPQGGALTRSIGIRYLRLSTGGMSDRKSFSQMTGMRSGYLHDKAAGARGQS